MMQRIFYILSTDNIIVTCGSFLCVVYQVLATLLGIKKPDNQSKETLDLEVGICGNNTE